MSEPGSLNNSPDKSDKTPSHHHHHHRKSNASDISSISKRFNIGSSKEKGGKRKSVQMTPTGAIKGLSGIHRQRAHSIKGGNQGPSGKFLSMLSMKGDVSNTEEVQVTYTGAKGGVSEKNTEKSDAELLRLRTKAFFAYSIYGHVYDWTLLFLSMVSCVAFIYQTYLPIDTNYSLFGIQKGAFLINSRLNKLELVLAFTFTCDFCLSLFMADRRVEFLRRYLSCHVKFVVFMYCNDCSFFSVVDILTVIPTWATLGANRPSYHSIHSFSGGILYILFLLKTTRILRPLRIRRKFKLIEDEVQRSIADMILRILVMILFSKWL